MDETEDLLTIEELAIFLNCSTGLIYKLKSQGSLPFIKIGTLLRFNKEDVIKSLQEKIKK